MKCKIEDFISYGFRFLLFGAIKKKKKSVVKCFHIRKRRPWNSLPLETISISLRRMGRIFLWRLSAHKKRNKIENGIHLCRFAMNFFWKDSFQVGFEMIDAIARAEGISMSSIRFKALLGNGLLLKHLYITALSSGNFCNVATYEIRKLHISINAQSLCSW